MHNGLLMTKFCPPINRLFYVPREELLENIISKFPVVSKKSRKAKEKDRKLNTETNGQKLIVKVIAAKGLSIPKDKLESYSTYVTVSILDQKEKTKPIKSTAYPVWNADFIFPLVGVNEVYDDLEIICLDYNHSEFIGEVKISLTDVREKAKQINEAEWFPLQKRNSNELIGSIILKFSIRDSPEEIKSDAPLKANTEKNLLQKPLLPKEAPKYKLSSPPITTDKTGRRLSM